MKLPNIPFITRVTKDVHSAMNVKTFGLKNEFITAKGSYEMGKPALNEIRANEMRHFKFILTINLFHD